MSVCWCHAQTGTNFPAVASSDSDRQVRGELLVKWQDGPESAAASRGNARIGAEVERSFRQIGWQHVQLPAGISVEDGGVVTIGSGLQSKRGANPRARESGCQIPDNLSSLFP
jgi:hypothetical protein